jgi:hypothetical protein
MRATDLLTPNGEYEPNASNEPGLFVTPLADNGIMTSKGSNSSKTKLLEKVNKFFVGKKRTSDS